MGTPKGMLTDHKNSDGLDNRRENIRICSSAQNERNQRTQTRTKSSVFKGVHWCNQCQKWIAKIKVNRVTIFIGGFHSEVDAALAYDVGAEKYHGEFARQNFLTV